MINKSNIDRKPGRDPEIEHLEGGTAMRNFLLPPMRATGIEAENGKLKPNGTISSAGVPACRTG